MATLTLIYGNGDTVTYGNDDVAVVVSNPSPVRKGIVGGKIVTEANTDKGIVGGTIFVPLEEPSRLSWFRTIIVNGRIYTEDFSNRTVTVNGLPYEEYAQDDAVADTVDDLLANDVESSSEVSSPSLGQVHALLANDVESSSEVTAPVLAEEGSTHDLLADDVESSSEVSSPAVGQVHALLADDLESSSEVSSPAVGQEHALLANDVESTSEVTAPALAEADHELLAEDVESSSEVSAPVIGQVHALTATSVESQAEVSTPSLGQVYALSANSIEATSEVSAPSLSAAEKSVSCILVLRTGETRPNLSALSWAWFDAEDPVNFIAPSDQGEVEVTDSTGLISVDIPNSLLSQGQTGTLVVRADDGSAYGVYNLDVA